MFFTYLTRELRRRRRQASLVAIGLAVGVGLVITVGAASNGVTSAQGQVLHSLYGVGTDLTVTKTPSFGSGGAFKFHVPGSTSGAKPTTSAGQHVSTSPGSGLVPAKDASTLADLSGVKAVVGSLSLNSFKFSGSFSPGSGGFGGAGGSGSGPPAGAGAAFSANTFTISGVDIAAPSIGPLSGAKVTSGAYFASSDSDSAVALADSAYAKQKGLKVGSTTTIGTTSFKVIGIASAPSGGTESDFYIPLAEAQSIAGDKSDYTTVYVESSTNSIIPTVKTEINKKLPSLTVTTAADLASQVSASLGTASGLSSSLGTWLAVIVLLVAFALAAMLTLSSVSNRVREFGTLKALGWRTRRIVGQIVAEGLVQGAVGAGLGVGLGFLGAFLVTKAGGTVHATVGGAARTSSASAGRAGAPGGFGGGGFGGAGGGAGRFLGASTHTVLLHLSAPVAAATIGLAIGLALAGGLLAGILGGWRVARLRPAEALRRVE
jgi:ABC-type antimicrobial peptide transport system permease subunit